MKSFGAFLLDNVKIICYNFSKKNQFMDAENPRDDGSEREVLTYKR